MNSLLAVATAYLIGSISFGVLASRIFGLPDPRTYGSGNPGATNVLRSGKKAAALFTLIGDTAKGALAVGLARWLGPGIGLTETGVGAVAIAAFLGHLYPVFYRFKGGKGVATAFGILLALSPWLALGTFLVFLGTVLGTRYVSLGSVLAGGFAAIAGPFLLGWGPLAGAVILMGALVVARHKPNLKRLIAGEESKLKFGKRAPG
jgi:acyl phosphate:glycerol-3-phosphate acyltransferase